MLGDRPRAMSGPTAHTASFAPGTGSLIPWGGVGGVGEGQPIYTAQSRGDWQGALYYRVKCKVGGASSLPNEQSPAVRRPLLAPLR